MPIYVWCRHKFEPELKTHDNMKGSGNDPLAMEHHSLDPKRPPKALVR